MEGQYYPQKAAYKPIQCAWESPRGLVKNAPSDPVKLVPGLRFCISKGLPGAAAGPETTVL